MTFGYNPFIDNFDFKGSTSGGTVTSVSGTPNRITVTGTTAPVVDIAATYVGQTSITTLGTIATGSWNATAIGPTKGGTGLTTYAQGDMLYASAANTLSSLAKNTTATRYMSNTGTSNNPAWAQVALGTGVSGTLPIANGGTNATSFTTSTGIAKYDGTSLVTSTATIDASNRMKNASQPLVLAYLNTTIANATGDGTSLNPIIFDTVSINQGSAYSTTTGLFTVPVTGNYLVSTSVTYSGVTASFTLGNLEIGNSFGTVWRNTFAPGKIFNSQANVTIQNSVVWPLTSGQTCFVTTLLQGGTKIVGIQGGNFGTLTWLNIMLLPA